MHECIMYIKKWKSKGGKMNKCITLLKEGGQTVFIWNWESDGRKMKQFIAVKPLREEPNWQVKKTIILPHPNGNKANILHKVVYFRPLPDNDFLAKPCSCSITHSITNTETNETIQITRNQIFLTARKWRSSNDYSCAFLI